MMSAQAQTRRTMSNALALLEDLMESIDGEQKERLSQTIAELEAIENNLEENDEEEVSLRDTHTTPIAYPRVSTINGCQPPSLYLEATVGDKSRRHRRLARWRIVGGGLMKPQGGAHGNGIEWQGVVRVAWLSEELTESLASTHAPAFAPQQSGAGSCD